MSEIITQILSMPPPFNMVVVIVSVVMCAKVVTSIASEIRKYASHRESAEVIRDLAERGMSAEQIERILNAGPETHYVNGNVNVTENSSRA